MQKPEFKLLGERRIKQALKEQGKNEEEIKTGCLCCLTICKAFFWPMPGIPFGL